MTTTAVASDRASGLTLVLTILSVVAAVATAGLGYANALAHDGGHALQVGAAFAFLLAVALACLAVAAPHLLEE